MPLSPSAAHRLAQCLPMSPDALSRTDSATLAVLVVDDEASVADELADTLLRRGMRVMTAGNGIEALSVLAARPDIGVLLTDIRMPGLCGLDLAQQALEGREAADALEVLLITGYATPAHGIAASRIGAFGVLPKPVRAARLAELVAAARERAAVRRRAAAEFGARRFDPRPPARHPNDPIAAAEALLHSLASRSEDAGKLAQIAAQAEGPLAALCDARDADARAVRLSALLRQVVELAALEQGRLPGDVTRASAHAIIGAVAARLAAAGIPCRQRIILQPEATPAFQVNLQRLGRAFGLLVERALGDAPGAASADLALDAEASQGRIELTIRTPPMPAAPDSPPHALLPITLARRLVALDGGRLDAWLLPEGGLRARMILGAA